MTRPWGGSGPLVGAATALAVLGVGSFGYGYANRDDEIPPGWTSYVPLSESRPHLPTWWYVGGGILVACGLAAYALAARRHLAKRG